jgi:5,10-methylenetetrahydromethanopterin reductase
VALRVRGVELAPEIPVGAVADLAATAEDAGFGTAFASHHYFNRDPFVALTQAAAATESVRVGPGVINPYETHPVTLAARVASLDEASGGRAVFGVGAGDPSALAALGIDRERPLRRVLETVRVARQLWAGETVTHEGTFVARDASLNFEPSAVPAYVGAQGPGMLRMAGKHADGVLVNAAHPRDLSWAADRVAEGAAESGNDPEAVAYASVSVADDDAAAREAARPPVAFIAAGAAGETLSRHDIAETDAAAVRDPLERGALDEAFAAVTPEMVDAFCIAGEPDTVERQLAAALDHVDGVVVGSPLGPDRARGITLAGAALDRCGPE